MVITLLLVFGLGALITGSIDYMMGIKFNNYPVIIQLIHKTTYLIWGGIIGILVSANRSKS